MGTPIKKSKLPDTDSIEELARFWDTHDLTDFEDELEEVTEPVFVRKCRTAMMIRLEPQEAEEVERIAKEKGLEEGALLREWVLERLRKS